MILGGGSSQINLLKKCRALNLFTILADINPDAPGRQYCDSFVKVSTFDCDGALNAAEKLKIDAIATAGTDQPVFTSAFVADRLSLPQFLTPLQAFSVTNKIAMKDIFSACKIKTAGYKVIDLNTEKKEIANLCPPYVIKPVDSQGQRGVMKLGSFEEVKNNISYALSFSREKKILLEEFYDSDEITLSGWISDGNLFILSITDRVTFENPPAIGICLSHQYPSPYMKTHNQEIIEITEKIIKSFHIKNGPVYFQYLIGSSGVFVNEIACRLGGAYEDEFIPAATGIDIADLLIKASLGKGITKKDFPGIKPSTAVFNDEYFSILLLFAKPGFVKSFSFPSPDDGDSSLLKSEIILKNNTLITPLANSTQRAGYAILKNRSIKNLNLSIEKFIINSAITSDKNENILYNEIEKLIYKQGRRFN